MLRHVAGFLIGTLLTLGPLPAGAQQATIQVAGPEESVVPAQEMGCADRKKREIDVPDMPPTAFRRPADGAVVMLATNRGNFTLEGPSLAEVERRSCHSLLASANQPDPQQFRDSEWLNAVLVLDDKRAVGLVHNEYHGEDHGHKGCVVTERSNRECWYASATLVLSDDGGMSFERPPAPANVLAALPYAFKSDMIRAGTYSPKALRSPVDGNLYVMVSFADRNRKIRIGQCLLRASPSDPLSWSAWDGDGFDMTLGSPYGKRSKGDCVPVVQGNVMSVKYVTKLGAYVSLAIARDELRYRFSKDLINWSRPKTLMTFEPFPGYDGGKEQPLWYFSMLDPESKSRNFDTIDGDAYLYYVKFHTKGGKIVNRRRDIARRKLEISAP